MGIRGWWKSGDGLVVSVRDDEGGWFGGLVVSVRDGEGGWFGGAECEI